MSKYYSKTIRIISIITLIAFVSTQVAFGYEGRATSIENGDCPVPTTVQSSGLSPFSHLRSEQVATKGNLVGTEIANSIGAPKPQSTASFKATGSIAEAIGNDQPFISKQKISGRIQRTLVLIGIGVVIIFPLLMVWLRLSKAEDRMLKTTTVMSQNMNSTDKRQRIYDTSLPVSQARLLEDAYAAYIALKASLKQDPFRFSMEVSIERIALEEKLVRLLGSDIPKKAITDRFGLIGAAQEIFLTYDILPLELYTFSGYDLDGYLKNFKRLLTMLPDMHIREFKVLLIQSTLRAASSSQEMEHAIVTTGRNLDDIPHEIGHLIWYSNTMRLNDQEYASFHNAFSKCKRFITGYASKDAVEDFAEMYGHWGVDTLAIFRYCLQEKTAASKDKALIIAKRFIFKKGRTYYLRTYCRGRLIVFPLKRDDGAISWGELSSIFKKLRNVSVSTTLDSAGKPFAYLVEAGAASGAAVGANSGSIANRLVVERRDRNTFKLMMITLHMQAIMAHRMTAMRVLEKVKEMNVSKLVIVIGDDKLVRQLKDSGIKAIEAASEEEASGLKIKAEQEHYFVLIVNRNSNTLQIYDLPPITMTGDVRQAVDAFLRDV